MNIYDDLKVLLDFFIQPFLSLLDDIGISDMDIKIGFDTIEWFNIKLYDLVYLVLGLIILYIFFRFIYRLIKAFVKLLTRGDYL